MRIVHLLNHCNHGHGNAHVAVDIACVQANRGHEVVYASAGGDYEQLLTSHNVINVRVVLNRRGALSLLKGLFSLIRLCREYKPDITTPI